MSTSPYHEQTLPAGVRSRMLCGINGLDVHILEAGGERPGRPLALLLHGFPDLAYGWRHLMPILAKAGYHVVAPDQRGYGRTTGWLNQYETSLAPFGLLNMVRDALGLVLALGHRRTALLVGHDFGSPVAAYCALARPDVFPSVVLMSAPFTGPPAFAGSSAQDEAPAARQANPARELAAALAALEPPRMHYQQYLGSRRANDDLWHPPQGLREFLRQFFHVKSGDWPGNEPHPLKSMAATEFARMPAYYVMEQGKTMPETVAALQRSHAAPTACGWLTETELGVYAREYERTGFQGALQGYRVVSDAELNSELRLFSGRTIDVPSLFIGGTRDWGPYAAPGALDVMRTKAATKLLGIELIQDAGHWIQQEKPSQLGTRLIEFLDEVGSVVP